MILKTGIFAALALLINSAFAQVRLDGVVAPGEYSSDKHYRIENGGELRLHKIDDKLFVALTAPARIWSHVYLYGNDTIRVMHASAALGQVAYVKNGDRWSPRGKFHYTVRERLYDDVLIKAQQDYLAQHGWVANNNNTGDGKTLEFCFDLARWKGSLRWAFVFMSDVQNPMYYPANLKDDTLLKELLYGGDPPEGMKFDVETWSEVR